MSHHVCFASHVYTFYVRLDVSAGVLSLQKGGAVNKEQRRKPQSIHRVLLFSLGYVKKINNLIEKLCCHLEF